MRFYCGLNVSDTVSAVSGKGCIHKVVDVVRFAVDGGGATGQGVSLNHRVVLEEAKGPYFVPRAVRKPTGLAADVFRKVPRAAMEPEALPAHLPELFSQVR